MAKRRGNPNWGKPEPIGPITPTITEFEQVVREYKLSPDQYLRSTRLREWARRNKNSKYIPEPLLEAWASRSNRHCKSYFIGNLLGRCRTLEAAFFLPVQSCPRHASTGPPSFDSLTRLRDQRSLAGKNFGCAPATP